MAFGDIIRAEDSPFDKPAGIGGDANTIWCCNEGPTNKTYELSTTDFSVVRSEDNPAYYAYGMGGDANTIWLCAYGQDLIYELSTTDFSVVRSEDTITDWSTGIGGDANTIWNCDAGVDLIYELSTTDFSLVRSEDSPNGSPHGIGGDANTIWHSDLFDWVYELSTTDFSVVKEVGSPGGYPYGIGGDANTIWHCDYGYGGRIYELFAADPPTVTTQAADPVGSTTATGHGTITDTGGINPTKRGIVYNTTGAPTREPTIGATPVVESTTPSNQDGNSTSFVMDMPETRPDGDLYIAWVAKDDDDAFTSVPGNWIELDVGVAATHLRCGLWYWIGDSEPESYTIEGDSEEWSGAILRISGQHAVNPFNKIGEAIEATNQTAAIPQVTPVCDNPLLLAFGGIDYSFWQAEGQYPDGWDGLFTQSSGSANSGSASAIGASKSGTKVVPSGAGVFTAAFSGQRHRTMIIAIAPILTPSADDYEEEEGDFGTGAFTRDLTGLDPETKYYAKAYATNLGGTGYGSQVEFDTPAPAGWSGKIMGVTNPAKVMGVDKTNIAKVKGVASA